jgi:hypothetical protein
MSHSPVGTNGTKSEKKADMEISGFDVQIKVL